MQHPSPLQMNMNCSYICNATAGQYHKTDGHTNIHVHIPDFAMYSGHKNCTLNQQLNSTTEIYQCHHKDLLKSFIVIYARHYFYKRRNLTSEQRCSFFPDGDTCTWKSNPALSSMFSAAGCHSMYPTLRWWPCKSTCHSVKLDFSPFWGISQTFTLQCIEYPLF